MSGEPTDESRCRSIGGLRIPASFRSPFGKVGGQIPISGRPMVNYVIEALHSSSCVGEIIVVAPAEIKDLLVPQARVGWGGNSLTENIFRAMDALERRTTSSLSLQTCRLFTPK